jgi:flagellar biosynthesis/type III secretory pathway chaperone
MNEPWINITENLRRELAEYGCLLRLFEDQQNFLFNRDANNVLRLSGEIEQQVRHLQESRRSREESVASFAAAHGQPVNATLRSLLPLFVPDVRPLLEALIGEVNVLIHRVRRASRHNHTLLARTVDTHQQLLRALQPDSFMQTYASSGRAALTTTRRTPALQAAG